MVGGADNRVKVTSDCKNLGEKWWRLAWSLLVIELADKIELCFGTSLKRTFSYSEGKKRACEEKEESILCREFFSFNPWIDNGTTCWGRKKAGGSLVSRTPHNLYVCYSEWGRVCIYARTREILRDPHAQPSLQTAVPFLLTASLSDHNIWNSTSPTYFLSQYPCVLNHTLFIIWFSGFFAFLMVTHSLHYELH